ANIAMVCGILSLMSVVCQDFPARCCVRLVPPSRPVWLLNATRVAHHARFIRQALIASPWRRLSARLQTGIDLVGTSCPGLHVQACAQCEATQEVMRPQSSIKRLLAVL